APRAARAVRGAHGIDRILTKSRGTVRRGSVGRLAAYRLVTDGVPIALVVVWYVVALDAPEYILPDPVKVLGRTFELLFANPTLAQHTYISLARVLVSVALSLVIGSALVLVARYLSVTRGLVVERLLPTLNAFPSLGWAIIGLYWFGVSDIAVIFVEVAILLPFAMINVWEGLKQLDEDTMEMAYSFTRARGKVLRKIVLPLLYPYLLAALRISYGVAWKVALVAELFGSSVGLGYLLSYSRQQFDSPMLFAVILTLIVLVYAVDKLVFERAEERVTRYRSGTASTSAI
nr:ABC transporter permease subunit [Actinomycetota bacterium]